MTYIAVHTDLVALYSPDLEDARLSLQQLKLFLPEEDSAAIWTIVSLYVEAWRIGLREEHPVVALRTQHGF